ncbi:MAG: hypothetical protein H7Y20_11005 [Bryobacteraceae bacterium]|nr:hypothetical protein [Bryobacteraceae bacterium]
MKLNLDTLKTEIDDWLKKTGFVVFYGFARTDVTREIDWDTEHHPDYKLFVDVAKQLEVRLVVLHQRQFNAAIIERAVEEVQASSLEYEEQRRIEGRLRELGMYDGFTCAVELSFDYQENMYVFELRTEWYDELHDMLDQLDIGIDPDEEDNDETYGGYYSKN